MSLIANSGKGKSFHHDHAACLKELDFYANEIVFFQKELNSVADKNTNNLSMVDQVKEYQKILKKKEGRIDNIKNSIKKHEHRIAEGNQTTEDLAQHELTMDEFKRFVVDFENVKKTLKRFASHND